MSNVHHIQNSKELEYLLSVHFQSVLVINFYTNWSSQSKIISAEFERLSRKPILQSLVLLHCHAGIHGDISLQYRVDIVPTVMFVEEGRVVDKLEGFNLKTLKRKLYQYAAKHYQCAYHLNASPDEMRIRMKALLKNTGMLLFINSYHSNTTWEFYALLDSLCASFQVFNVTCDSAVEKVLKKCWNITTYPYLFVYGKCLGNIETVRTLKNNKKEGTFLRRAIDEINKLENCNSDPMAVSMFRVKKLLMENKIVVFLEVDEFKPDTCDTRLVLEILCANSLPFASFNVLQDLNVRKTVQSISQWPTFPQVFVNGLFIGSVDNLLALSGDRRNIGALKSYCTTGIRVENAHSLRSIEKYARKCKRKVPHIKKPMCY